MDRIDYLNKHLDNLTSLQTSGAGDFADGIMNVVEVIKKELGIGEEANLSSYSTKELHEELIKREGVREICIDSEQEAVVTQIIGDAEKSHSVKGPAQILVNQG